MISQITNFWIDHDSYKLTNSNYKIFFFPQDQFDNGSSLTMKTLQNVLCRCQKIWNGTQCHLHKRERTFFFYSASAHLVGFGIFICHYKVLDGVLKNPSSCQSYVLEKGCVDRLAHQEVSLSLSYWKKCNNWNQWKQTR